jgi:hypothetical protein
MHRKNLFCTLLLFVGWLCCFQAVAQTNPEDETEFTIYGFGRANFIWDNQNLGRNDIFLPSNIQVNTAKDPNFFIGAKQSRIGIDIKHPLNKDDLSIKLEGDFHNDATDATGLFRMRHAFASYKFVLVGMTWSNFYDPDIKPVLVDFEAPNSSTLARNPQLRFFTYKTNNELSLSFENPTEKLTLPDSITVLPERFPDVIGAYRLKGNFGSVKIAGLFRELRYKSDRSRSLYGYGVTLMGVIHLGETDKFKFQGVAGTGVAKYIEGANSLNYDAIPNGTNKLEELTMQGGFISYQHFWKEHLYSSLTGGILAVENNSNLSGSKYKSGYFGSINLFYAIVKNLTFGWEAVYGERKNFNDDTGSALRLQMNATYDFSRTIK